jgi:hypothetical protein
MFAGATYREHRVPLKGRNLFLSSGGLTNVHRGYKIVKTGSFLNDQGFCCLRWGNRGLPIPVQDFPCSRLGLISEDDFSRHCSPPGLGSQSAQQPCGDVGASRCSCHPHTRPALLPQGRGGDGVCPICDFLHPPHQGLLPQGHDVDGLCPICGVVVLPHQGLVPQGHDVGGVCPISGGLDLPHQGFVPLVLSRPPYPRRRCPTSAF